MRPASAIGRSLLAALLTALVGGPALAQDDGPRVYQLVPEGAQNLTAFAVVKRGAEGLGPDDASPGVRTSTDILVLRYARTLSLAGRQFTPFVIVPTGRVGSDEAAADSAGLGDMQLGATLGLVGAPALSRQDYGAFRPFASVSLLGRIYLPTGAYDASLPANLGANRLAWQLGLPTTFMFGQAYGGERLTALEVLPTLTFYGANEDAFGGGRFVQEPLFGVEAHLTRNLSRRVWVSADLLFRQGGRPFADGALGRDATSGWSAGGSLALPLIRRASLILTYEHVVERWDSGPDGWFFRAALVAPF